MKNKNLLPTSEESVSEPYFKADRLAEGRVWHFITYVRKQDTELQSKHNLGKGKAVPLEA
jgi:hypothetical protein